MMRSWTPSESLIAENARTKATKAAMAEDLPVIEPGSAERPQDWLTPDS
jgi:hypothetical protein